MMKKRVWKAVAGIIVIVVGAVAGIAIYRARH